MMTEIIDRLYVGNVIDAQELVGSNPNNIEVVLNLSTEPPYPLNPTIEYKECRFEDNENHPMSYEKFQEIMAFLDSRSDKRILIHCQQGVNRAPTVTAAWLTWTNYSKSFESAVELVRLKRQNAQRDRIAYNMCLLADTQSYLQRGHR